jgi:hypothetical protein
MTGTPRGAMTKARKRRIWEAYDQRCGTCRAPVPMIGPGVTYDHHWQLAMDGPETDDNVRPLCDICSPPKTKADAQARGKVRRLVKKGKPPAERKPKSGRKMRSRPFQRILRKKLNGTVERRR